MRLFHIKKRKSENVVYKKDCIFIAAVLFAAVISALAAAKFQSVRGQSVRITIDGEIYGEYSLAENSVVTIEGTHGYNKVIIENGEAYMDDADCPDKYCMEYKPVSKGNETIICLPHRLVVEVVGKKEVNQPDIVAK